VWEYFALSMIYHNFCVRELVLPEEGLDYSGERLLTLMKPAVILRATHF
jgi:hypothetical protein